MTAPSFFTCRGDLTIGPAHAQAQALLREVGLPNCYSLTKHMAESLLADAHAAGRMRVAIVRPSVIGCIACAPLPGYSGNAAGVTSATLAFASGAPITFVLRSPTLYPEFFLAHGHHLKDCNANPQA